MKCIGRCKTNIFKQCTLKSINNTLYCFKHQNTMININTDLYDTKTINNFINLYINNNITKLTKDDKLLMKYILQYYQYNFNVNLNNKDTLLYFNEFINLNKIFLKNIVKIILIQSIFRMKYIKFINKLRGPALFNRKISTNETDFYTFDNINTIPINYFYSFSENNTVYSFDIRSFKLLIEQNNKNNPYNRNNINKINITNSLIIIKYLEYNNLFEIFEEDILTEEQKLTQKIINIFQKIDNFGYNTNISWFSSLSLQHLKKFWINLEDIWNYRCNLSIIEKKNIIKNNKPFLNFYKINKYINKTQLQYVILDDINIFISNGNETSDSNIGCLYVLTALSQVSYNCLESMPWLSQH